MWCEHCDPTSCPLAKKEQPAVIFNEQHIKSTTKNCIGPTQIIDGEEWCRTCDVNLRVCAWWDRSKMDASAPCVDARQDSNGKTWCRHCDLPMGLGSSSLTMVELSRAYSAFQTYGHLVEPHFINRVVDLDGTVIEEWQPPVGGWPEVLEPAVAGITHWLVRQVATGGTAGATNSLGIQVAGKTGTTNDFHDAWFVGYNHELITSTWVGYDRPRSLGVSSTGGKTALPIWMDFMRVAAPKDKDQPFPKLPAGVHSVPIDETTGRQTIGGRQMPMLPGTEPTNVIGEIGQIGADDIMTEDF